MTPDRLFQLASALVGPCWLLLLVAPRWRWTQRVVTFGWPAFIAVVYVWLLVSHRPPPGSGFSSLAQVQALFSSPYALVAGWIHYLAFDLFIGAWEARDGLRLGISRWLLLPCQLLTFFFGPAGLALYLLLKLVVRRQVGAGAPDESRA